MRCGALGALAALLAATAASGAVAAAAPLYRIDLKGGGVVWTAAPPRASGAVLLFTLHPRGPLTSVKRAEVMRVVEVAVETAASAPAGLRPGGHIVLGSTGRGTPGVDAAARSPASPPAGAGPRPGELRDGTALFNPDRAYRPEWDSRQVPGLNMGLPNSPDDYKEGLTVAFPPASAVQAAPGQPPMMPPSSGELPR